MLKYLERMEQYRPIILVVLALPLLGIFVLGKYRMQVVPEYPYVEFAISFNVPGRIATEIEKNVTSVAERVFNGLPGLVNLESSTEHESARIRLRFEKGTDNNTALLFIQEKMDRLNIMLPSDVKKVHIDQLGRRKVPDVLVEDVGHISSDVLRNAFRSLNNVIIETDPGTDVVPGFRIRFDPLLLAENRLSIDQVWKALKVSGFTYRLGRKNGLSYFLESEFNDAERLKGTIVGSRGQRPLKITDVAAIEYVAPLRIDAVSVTIDRDKMSLLGFSRKISELLPGSSIKFTKTRLWAGYLVKSVMGLLVLILLQVILFLRVFRNRYAVISVVIFDFLFMIHYFFWIGFFRGELTYFDITAIHLPLVMGTMFWLVLLGRIRSYYQTTALSTHMERPLEQVTLFAIAEYFPTFLMLLAMGFLFSLPCMLSDVNLPSQYILETVFTYGGALILVILLFLPVLTPLRWIQELDSDAGKSEDKCRLTSRTSILTAYVVGAIAIVSIVFWYHVPYGMRKSDTSDVSDNGVYGYESQIDSFRGYSNKLGYQVESANRKTFEEKNGKDVVFLPDRSLRRNWMLNWEITPNGLALLAGLDISMFQTALSSVQQSEKWSGWRTEKGEFPIAYSPLVLDRYSFSNLLVGARDSGAKPVRLGLLANPLIRKVPDRIFRSQLARVDEFNFIEKNGSGRFQRRLPENARYSPVSGKWMKEYREFIRTHWMMLVFLFILGSLYLNSFFRGMVLSVMVLAGQIFMEILKITSDSPYVLDSLWIIWLPMWMIMFVILVLTRMADVERARGNDMTVVVEEVEKSIAPGVRSVVPFIAGGFFMVGLLNHLPWFVRDDLMNEAMLVGVSLAIAGYAAYYFLFRLFYISSEFFIDRNMFRFLGWYFHIVRKTRKRKH